jgi:methionine-rich copper-binding protein CopC
MKIMRMSFAAVAFASPGLTGSAWAHAFLDHAVPSVGSTSQGPTGELTLIFTQNIVAAFSGASLNSAAGASIPTGKAKVDPSDPATLRVPLGRKLAPGTYVVHWHVVSVDTHHTSGSYKFTVAP